MKVNDTIYNKIIEEGRFIKIEHFGSFIIEVYLYKGSYRQIHLSLDRSNIIKILTIGENG